MTCLGRKAIVFVIVYVPYPYHISFIYVSDLNRFEGRTKVNVNVTRRKTEENSIFPSSVFAHVSRYFINFSVHVGSFRIGFASSSCPRFVSRQDEAFGLATWTIDVPQKPYIWPRKLRHTGGFELLAVILRNSYLRWPPSCPGPRSHDLASSLCSSAPHFKRKVAEHPERWRCLTCIWHSI